MEQHEVERRAQIDMNDSLVAENTRLKSYLEEAAKGDVYSREQAIEKLFDWQYRRGTSFACKLFVLMGSTDHLNLARMELAWPNLVGAWREWRVVPDEEAWFESHGLDCHGRNIIVNGKRVAFTKRQITYEQVSELAGKSTDSHPTIVFTDGLDPDKGILTHGQFVDVRPDMKFEVHITGNA